MPESRPKAPARKGPYQPTGRPPGRPRKDGQPKANENPDGTPKPPRTVKVRPDTAVVPDHPANAPAGTHKPGPFRICSQCYPKGWPKGWTGTSCEHGTWARPPVK